MNYNNEIFKISNTYNLVQVICCTYWCVRACKRAYVRARASARACTYRKMLHNITFNIKLNFLYLYIIYTLHIHDVSARF